LVEEYEAETQNSEQRIHEEAETGERQ
jgi:hypothetical protein